MLHFNVHISSMVQFTADTSAMIATYILDLKIPRLFLCLCLLLSSAIILAGCTKYDEDPTVNGDLDAIESDGPASDSDMELETTDGDTSEVGDQDFDLPLDFPVGPYGVTVGDTISNFQLQDCDGNEVQLKDYFGSAKVILINKVAGWCTVCRREIPLLQEWYADLHEDGFELLQPVIEKSIPGQPADVEFCRSWRERYEIEFPVLVDPDNIFLGYHKDVTQPGTPLNILLDRNMRIVLIQEGDVPESIKDRIVTLLEDD